MVVVVVDKLKVVYNLSSEVKNAIYGCNISQLHMYLALLYWDSK